MIPPLRALVQRDTVRLIPSQYSDDGASVLARIEDVATFEDQIEQGRGSRGRPLTAWPRTFFCFQ